MKKLKELGISPAPWKFIHDNVVDDFECGVVYSYDCSYLGIDDGNLIAAAPKFYAKAYEIAENLRIHLAVPTQSITMNRAEVEAMAKELEAVLAEAAGECEVAK